MQNAHRNAITHLAQAVCGRQVDMPGVGKNSGVKLFNLPDQVFLGGFLQKARSSVVIIISEQLAPTRTG